MYYKDSFIICLWFKYLNYVWSIDFVYDKFSNGWFYKMLIVFDEYMREVFMVVVNIKMGNVEVLEEFYLLFFKYGKFEFICFDNGLEFVVDGFWSWFIKVGIKLIRIYLGLLWENGYNEWFNGILR